MRSLLALALVLPLPAFAQDADPSNQLLEGYVACAMGEGLPDKTLDALSLYGWTFDVDIHLGTYSFLPGVGEDTFAFMSPTPDYCQVESTVLGTDRAVELMGYLSTSGVEIADTETNYDGCVTLTLSNGVVAVITSGGTEPVCTSDKNSAVRFFFGEDQ